MSHTKEDQKLLDSMTQQEKNKRTTRQQFLKRGNMIKEYEYRYVTENEYPHENRSMPQYVLRHYRIPAFGRDKVNITAMEGFELAKIIQERSQNYEIHIHKKKNRSVGRFHLHIYK